MEEEEHEGIHLVLETLVMVIMLSLYITIGPLLKRLRVKFIYASGVTMIVGILISLLVILSQPESNFSKGFHFNNVFFFTFVLPLIIFSSGYNLRQDLFFKNFRFIALFAFIGTFVSFFLISFFTYIASEHQLFTLTRFSFGNSSQIEDNITTDLDSIIRADNVTVLLNDSSVPYPLPNVNDNNADDDSSSILHFSLWEIFLFASAMSASDTGSSAYFFREDTEAKLSSISFGESILNDAVSIALFKIVSSYMQNEAKFNIDTAWDMFGGTILLFVFSFIIGLIIGGVCSNFLFRLKHFNLNRVQEISIMLLFAFISYILSDWIHLSPIISLLSCGIFMSHYTFYNLCFQSREESSSISRILNILAEALAFSFLGLTLVSFSTQAISITFVMFGIGMIILTRFISVFGLIWICRLLGSEKFNLKTSYKGIITFSGTIRGAVSFALAIGIKCPNKINQEVLISSSIYIVFITTVLFDALMPVIINLFRMCDKNKEGKGKDSSMIELSQDEDLFTFLHPNFNQITKVSKKELNMEELKKQISYWLGHYWVEFDDVCIRPKLCFNWPLVKEDNDQITQRIKQALQKYQHNKEMPSDNLFKTPIKKEMTLISSSRDEDDKKSPLIQEKLEFYSDEKAMKNK